MEVEFDPVELAAGIVVTGGVAGFLSVVTPASFALAAGLALGLPFLAVGAKIVDPSIRERFETAGAALVVGIAAAAFAGFLLPAAVHVPVVVALTYLAGATVAVTG